MKRNKLAHTGIFMVTAFFVAILLITKPLHATTDKKISANEKPNIVLMMADNLGYGDLGVYGGGENRGMPTANIDQLANDGLRFGQFLVEPGCTPTRAATLTGRYSIRSGLSSVIIQGTPNTLQAEEVTMAEMLKEQGYSTAMYGKWHLGFEEHSQPQNQGFEEFYGIAGSTGEIEYASSMREQGIEPSAGAIPHIYEYDIENDEMIEVKDYTEETRRTIDVEIADKSVAYIQAHANSGPFFLFIPWTRPHFPNYTSEEFVGKSRSGLYGDSVMELDHNTGRVLDAIKDSGIESNTIVIWMSDNGPMRTVVWPDAGFQGPYRGELGDPHEGSVRTAGMIKWPEHIQPGLTYGMFSCMDFFPTLATFAGAQVSNDRPIDGIDQSDFLLAHQDGMGSNREHLLTFMGDELMAVRWKQFRIYFDNILPRQEFMATEGSASMTSSNLNPIIYNIERDPRESTDVAIYNVWILPFVQKYIREYLVSLVDHPNSPSYHIDNLQEYVKACSKNPSACQQNQETN